MTIQNIQIPTIQVPQEAPAPFLKWAGGKGRLLDQILPHFPETWGTYFEPFIGGGATFFNLRPESAVISDVNERLIAAYVAIRDELPALVEELDRLVARHSKDAYYRARERFNRGRNVSDLERAALMIYLNKTCFNGLYRENSRGEFNVPMGSYVNPSVYRMDNLAAVSAQLQDTDIRVASYEHVLESAKPGDLVYFDPPYVPVSATSSFTSYVGAGFDLAMQQRLAEIFTELAHRGVHVFLSNSDSEVVRELYHGWRMETVRAGRGINSRADRRGAVNEILVIGQPRVR